MADMVTANTAITAAVIPMPMKRPFPSQCGAGYGIFSPIKSSFVLAADLKKQGRIPGKKHWPQISRINTDLNKPENFCLDLPDPRKSDLIRFDPCPIALCSRSVSIGLYLRKSV